MNVTIQVPFPRRLRRHMKEKGKMRGHPFRRQLKHLNNRKKQRVRAVTPNESGSDVGVRAKDGCAAHERGAETLAAGRAGAPDSTSPPRAGAGFGRKGAPSANYSVD